MHAAQELLLAPFDAARIRMRGVGFVEMPVSKPRLTQVPASTSASVESLNP